VTHRLTIAVCAAILVLFACAPRGGDAVLAPHIDPDLFQESKSSALCFDLSDPHSILGGVKIKRQTAAGIVQRSIVLPFEVKRVHRNNDVWLTYASYSDGTLINYVTSPDSQTNQLFSFVPDIQDLDAKGNEALFDKMDFDEPLTFVHAGLKYRFFFRRDLARKIAAFRYVDALPHEIIDEILVRIPRDARELPSPEGTLRGSFASLRGARVGSFDATMAVPAPVDVTYQIKPSTSLTKAAEFLGKLFVLIAEPLIAWFFASSNLPAATRKRVLVGGIIVEVIIAAALIAWAIYVAPVLGYDQLYDVILAILGIVSAIAVAKAKG